MSQDDDQLDDDGGARICVACSKTAPGPKTASSLISSKHGWRLSRLVGRGGVPRFEWWCPECWKQSRSRESTTPEYEVAADVPKRTLRCRMKGIFNVEEMKAWAATYRRETDRFRGRKHVVIADMRGMRPARPEAAEIMGTEIGHARRHGVVLCAHLSDDTVQRLQAARVARQNSPGDDVTVDVVSVEEAEKLADEAAARIDDATPIASIRAPT